MKPHICKLEDGSVLIEWIEKKRRFGISIEPNIEESCWYYVTKKGKDNCSGLIFEKTLDKQ